MEKYFVKADELDVHGALIGIKFEGRDKPGDKKLMQLYIKDAAGDWHKKDVTMSVFWIDDFIKTLQKAKMASSQEALNG